MVMQFFLGGGWGAGGGKEEARCIMAYVKMVNSVFLKRIQPFKLQVYFAVFASMVWELSALQKKKFRCCGYDCCLHQHSTSTINTIILELRRLVFYDGSN